jgi:hypothetical protein
MTRKHKALKSSKEQTIREDSQASPTHVITGVPAVPPEPTPATTPIREEAATSSAVPPLNTSSLDDKAKGKAITDVEGWTVEDVANWLKREEFDQGICDKFAGASFSFSFTIPELHICDEQQMMLRVRSYWISAPKTSRTTSESSHSGYDVRL